jgi:hypothetical protein
MFDVYSYVADNYDYYLIKGLSQSHAINLLIGDILDNVIPTQYIAGIMLCLCNDMAYSYLKPYQPQ